MGSLVVDSAHVFSKETNNQRPQLSSGNDDSKTGQKIVQSIFHGRWTGGQTSEERRTKFIIRKVQHFERFVFFERCNESTKVGRYEIKRFSGTIPVIGFPSRDLLKHRKIGSPPMFKFDGLRSPDFGRELL
jgi:hypothetical protein